MLKIIYHFFLILTIISITLPASAYVPIDPMYPLQNYLTQINVSRAWDISKGEGVVVAVLDSGVDINHPDLKMNIWTNADEVADDGIDNDHNGFVDDGHGWDFVANVNDPSPKFDDGYIIDGINHGTAIAGLIGAVGNNARGLIGVAFYAKIMPLRVLAGDGAGDVETLIKAIKYAVNNGAGIINLSLVGYDYSENLLDIIKWANSKGVVFVAAAGNTNSAIAGIDLDFTPAYPACYGDNLDNNWVLAISSVNVLDKKSSFANYGSSCIDLAAPGEGFTSLAFYHPEEDDFNDYYSYNWSGTSFATALVSGVAALVKSKNKSFTPDELVAALTDYSTNIDSKNIEYQGQLGFGLVNAFDALSAKPVSISTAGRLIRLKTDNAVYYVDANNVRHLFPSEVVYWSWYEGSWAQQEIEFISQAEFDELKIGDNIIIRAGTNLIRFKNSPKIYAVTPGAALCQIINDNSAVRLYGADWQKRLVTVQNAFENNYVRDKNCQLNSQSEHPEGSLIQYVDSKEIWYIDGGFKRQVDSDAFKANSFQGRYLIKNVSSKIIYNIGRLMTGWENDIFKYAIN